jgi:hypothetical protein
VRVDTRPRRKNAPRIAEKVCRICGAFYTKPPKISWAQWETRVACGVNCGQTKPLLERLLSRTDKSGPDGCWLWTGCKDRNGYGVLTVKKDWKQSNKRTHRLMYLAAYGVDPGSLCVMHSCDNPSCVNPDHLSLGTNDDNTADRERKGRNRPPKGEAHGNAKLTDDAVRFIRGSSLPRRILAQRFKVSPSLIGCVRRRLIWRHIA